MPAAARYMAMGEPRPPAPMHSTLVEQIFFWPGQPDFGQDQVPRIAANFVIVQFHTNFESHESSSGRINQVATPCGAMRRDGHRSGSDDQRAARKPTRPDG